MFRTIILYSYINLYYLCGSLVIDMCTFRLKLSIQFTYFHLNIIATSCTEQN